MRTFSGMQNAHSERLSNLPKVTQPRSSHLLAGGECKAYWNLEEWGKDFETVHLKCIVELKHAFSFHLFELIISLCSAM